MRASFHGSNIFALGNGVARLQIQTVTIPPSQTATIPPSKMKKEARDTLSRIGSSKSICLSHASSRSKA